MMNLVLVDLKEKVNKIELSENLLHGKKIVIEKKN
jgi:hypothetical protein